MVEQKPKPKKPNKSQPKPKNSQGAAIKTIRFITILVFVFLIVGTGILYGIRTYIFNNRHLNGSEVIMAVMAVCVSFAAAVIAAFYIPRFYSPLLVSLICWLKRDWQHVRRGLRFIFCLPVFAVLVCLLVASYFVYIVMALPYCAGNAAQAITKWRAVGYYRKQRRKIKVKIRKTKQRQLKYLGKQQRKNQRTAEWQEGRLRKDNRRQWKKCEKLARKNGHNLGELIRQHGMTPEHDLAKIRSFVEVKHNEDR